MSASRGFNCNFSRPIFRVGEILKFEIIHVGTEIFEVDLFVSVELETIHITIREEQSARGFIYEKTKVFVISLPCRIKGYRRPFQKPA